MLTLASIDVGSNTIRLLIVAVEGERITDIHSARRITRLGNNVHQTGTLQDRNMEDSIAVLKEFSSAITHYGVNYTKAVGTSALREANECGFVYQKGIRRNRHHDRSHLRGAGGCPNTERYPCIPFHGRIYHSGILAHC